MKLNNEHVTVKWEASQHFLWDIPEFLAGMLLFRPFQHIIKQLQDTITWIFCFPEVFCAYSHYTEGWELVNTAFNFTGQNLKYSTINPHCTHSLMQLCVTVSKPWWGNSCSALVATRPQDDWQEYTQKDKNTICTYFLSISLTHTSALVELSLLST